MRLGVYRQVGAFGEVLSEQTIGVLVGTPLPRTARVTEVNIDVRRQSELAVIREFFTTVPGERFIELAGQLFRLLDERGDYRLRILVGDLHQHHVPAMTFDQGGDLKRSAQHFILNRKMEVL